jgi:hypothetical protein
MHAKLTHRILWLDDLTRRDINRWRSDDLAKEIDQTFEYTLIFEPAPDWSLLAGLKFEEYYESDLDQKGLVAREFYLKAERHFSIH